MSQVGSDINYDEVFYPARPRAARPKARRNQQFGEARPPFEPVGTNPAYVHWLRSQSMLGDARALARQLSGQASMWQHAYARPDPRRAVQTANVWVTSYPLAVITRPGQSFLGALGDPRLWSAFEQIGIDAIHTGPLKRAGGIEGWDFTPSVDGHFDRISMAIDSVFGTEDEFREMCAVAKDHGGTIIDDIVPGHTGKGADFRLAEMNYRDYPGLYHMIDIPESDWHLLPEVPDGQDSVNLDRDTERALQEAGYIIGELQRVIFYEPGVKETNWSVTRTVLDTEGKPHRWVYLHYFKDGQPSLNWLDPTFSGMRLVMGDALHSLLDLGAGGLRLDANGFLGVEKGADQGAGWSEGHPLSEAANQLLGSMVRKVGGFTFQELNLSIDDIKATSANGPDLSYDFVTRPAYHHALVTGDTEFLRLTLREALAIGVDPAGLVHALQNHDELTYELIHFAVRHRDRIFEFDGRQVTGGELAEEIQETLRQRIAGPAAPYNLVFTTNGIACTTASVVTAALGITDLDAITDNQVERIRDGHLLLAMYNALQPGVFALSGWDLRGVLPLPQDEVRGLISRGDTRWINRGAHNLMGSAPESRSSGSGLPRAQCLYAPLPEQLEDERSFARRLADVLAVRKEHGIAAGKLLEVPEPNQPGLLAMVQRTATAEMAVTALNFSSGPLSCRVESTHLEIGTAVTDAFSGKEIGTVDEHHGFPVQLPAHQGTLFLIRAD
ncbi:MAG: maltose alpha-D-glucosyltransferase [Micrococcus sp.]|nr:maltose alpha-D-glucosyltransferase [Micrococcus sp.]